LGSNIYILEGSQLTFLTIFIHVLLTTSIHESPLHKYNKCPIHLHAVVLQFFYFLFLVIFIGCHKDVCGWLLKFWVTVVGSVLKLLLNSTDCAVD